MSTAGRRTDAYVFRGLDDTELPFTIPADGPNSPYDEEASADLPVVRRERIVDRDQFLAFGCKVRDANPDTPDEVVPDVTIVREVHSGGRVTMPDGRRIRFWGFDDPESDVGKAFPSPLIRVREGQVVHTRMLSSKNTHTIHHHGIEPIPHNDGVGHTSFEVDDVYDYQWRPSQSGLYFYHCHKNTVLHFELGMYGPLIVDPPEGEGYVRRGTDVVPYDHEALWIADDVDPRWHRPDIDHSAGLDCLFDDGQLPLDFTPEYFLISGVPHPRSRTDGRVAVECTIGDRVLIRLLNAAYGGIRVSLPFDAEVVGMDGHALGGPRTKRYSRPFVIPAGEPFELSTAQRWDLLVEPDRRGEFTVGMDVRHWVRGNVHGRMETTITVV